MIKKYQRHPDKDDTVILHLGGQLALVHSSPTVEVENQAYRDALEAADKMED